MEPRAEAGTEIAGLDALESEPSPHKTRAARLWRDAWPKLAAAAIAIGVWQALVWSGWRPVWILPGPAAVFRRLFDDLSGTELPHALRITLGRAALGYGLAVVAGSALGLVVSRSRIARSAVGSLITGLQTMPSIAWFPLATLLFGLSDGAILFVVVLGAAPSIANGLIAGVDNIQPILLRAGRMLGARGVDAYRYVILPAALPGFVAGLKQGWAFAWRSLMAGELLKVIAGQPSIGERLQFARDNADGEGILAMMLVILIVGILVDALVFRALEVNVRRRWGLHDSAA